MKKVGLMLVMLLSSVIIVTAQVSIIPKAGVNFSDVKFDNDLSGQGKSVGLNVGVGFNFPLTPDKFVSLQPELLFTQKGYKVDQNIISDYRNTFNYLEMPLMLRLAVGGDMIMAYVNAGPHIGYMLNRSISGVLDTDQNPQIDFDEERFEYGLNFGGGIGIGIGVSKLLLDIRYTAGLRDVENKVKSKNNVITVGAGIQIPIY